MSCEIPLLLFAPVPSEGQKGVLGRKPWLSAEVQRKQREHAALEDFDLRRAWGQSASEQGGGRSPFQHPSLPRRTQELVAVIVAVPVVGMPCGCCVLKLCSRTTTVPWHYTSTELREPQNLRLWVVLRDLKDHLDPTPCQGRDATYYTRLPRTPSHLAMNSAKDRASITSLG